MHGLGFASRSQQQGYYLHCQVANGNSRCLVYQFPHCHPAHFHLLEKRAQMVGHNFPLRLFCHAIVELHYHAFHYCYLHGSVNFGPHTVLYRLLFIVEYYVLHYCMLSVCFLLRGYQKNDNVSNQNLQRHKRKKKKSRRNPTLNREESPSFFEKTCRGSLSCCQSKKGVLPA